MSIDASITDTMREEAATWLIELGANPDPTLQDAFQEWLHRDQRHQRVFAQMQGLWTAARPAKKASRLSQVLTVAGLFVLVSLISLQQPWHYWAADYHTGIGEVRTVTLPDGSVATLNTHSAIDIDFNGNQRRLVLRRGEVLLEVNKDRYRPFIVDTANASAKALGTRYSVSQGDDASVVTVYESQVLVTATQGQHSAVLRAGQQALVENSRIIKQDIDLPATPDWARHKLVFRNTPLEEVVGRLQRYHPGTIKLSRDITTNQRHFTGVLPSDDPDAAINLLSSSMALDIHGISPWLVYLTPRAAP